MTVTRLGYGLQMHQTQRLMMTPELRQAIAILQLPVTSLEDFIEQELLENPCLEAESKEEPDEPDEMLPPQTTAQFLDYLDSSHRESRPSMLEDGEESGYEAFAATVPTLHDYLIAQLLLMALEPMQRRLCEFLIGSLDDHGYLTMELHDVATAFDTTPDAVESALQVLQGFDPSGVGARSLKECLRLQWATVDDGNPFVLTLIEHHLDDLAEGRVARIAEGLGITPVAVQEAADLIRTLDPKPGRRFGQPNQIRYVVPDVIVERVGNEYVVLVNEAPVPRLVVSQHYRQLLKGQIEEPARKFVEQKIHSALWLMKAVEQRRLTLQSVTEALVQFQRAFFDHGVRHLRPLTLKDVADEVGVHESTVSRATAGKYLQSPRGVFELKFFFSSGVEDAAGGGVASKSVKRLMADLVVQENVAEPLSDLALASLLKQQGVQISRRTVAKYREEMGVPSSGKRKRYS